MSAPLILLYNLDNPRGSKLRRMCLPLKLRTRLVSKEEYALPLSVLAEGAGRAAPHPDQDFDDEMLLLCGLTGPQLDAFLQGFRRNRLPPVALKAVLTRTNRDWDSFRLHAELLREREALASGRAVHDNEDASGG